MHPNLYEKQSLGGTMKEKWMLSAMGALWGSSPRPSDFIMAKIFLLSFSQSMFPRSLYNFWCILIFLKNLSGGQRRKKWMLLAMRALLGSPHDPVTLLWQTTSFPVLISLWPKSLYPLLIMWILSNKLVLIKQKNCSMTPVKIGVPMKSGTF